jgi:hypothetical protein
MSSAPAASVHTVLAGLMVALTAVGFFSERAFAAAVLVPGNALLLGEHNAWSFLTAHFVSPSWALLAFHAAIVVGLGWRSEEPGGPHAAARVAGAAGVALAAAGLCTYAVRLALFMGSANEEFLYKPVAGCGPVAVVAAVLATEVHGDAPLHAAAAIPTSLLPLLIVALSAATQNAGVSSDASSTLTAGVVAWLFLRFFAAHGGAGAPLGDARDAFEFLVFAPAPLRVALRPLEKVGSALLFPVVLRVAGAYAGAQGLAATTPPPPGAYGEAGAPGAGSAAAALFGLAPAAPAAPAPGGAVGAGTRIDPALMARVAAAGATGVSVDPIAERRREKALKSLDARLAQMRDKLRGAGPPVTTLAASPTAERAETV